MLVCRQKLFLERTVHPLYKLGHGYDLMGAWRLSYPEIALHQPAMVLRAPQPCEQRHHISQRSLLKYWHITEEVLTVEKSAYHHRDHRTKA
jgi:hypothetical protein